MFIDDEHTWLTNGRSLWGIPFGPATVGVSEFLSVGLSVSVRVLHTEGSCPDESGRPEVLSTKKNPQTSPSCTQEPVVSDLVTLVVS